MNNTKLKYIFKNIALAYDIDENLWEQISFGDFIVDNKPIHIYTKPELAQQPIWDNWKNDAIPFLFDCDKQEEIILKKDNILFIHYDVLNPIYYLLSGEQEIKAPRDKYGRFQWKDSLQCKHNFTTIPVVNYYMDIIVNALSQVLNIPINTKQTKPTIHLTHDIDEVNSAWKQRVRLAFEDKQYFKALKYFISQPFKPFYPWKNLQEIVELELDLGYTPTFYFLPRTGFKNEIKNADYILNDSYIKNTIDYLVDKEINIGVHGSYRTHDEFNEFLIDKKLLEAQTKQEITLNRFHWLQFDIVKTPPLLEKANIKIDSTLGFQEHIGFRNGCCTPFYLYNHKTNQSTQVIEHPLTVMDCSLAFNNYMELDVTNGKKAIKNLYNSIKKFNGLMVFNYHNTFLTPYRNKEWFEMYKEVLKGLGD